MKSQCYKHTINAALAALALALSSNVAQSASDIIIGPSGTQTGTSGTAPDFSWSQLWGPAFVSVTFDTNNPPATGDTQGAIYLQNNWTTNAQDTYCIAAPAGWFGGATFDASQYASIEMDVKYDTNSTITPSSDANIGVGFDTWYNFQSVTNISFNGAIGDGGWHHLSIPLDPSMAGVATAHSVGFYTWKYADLGTMNFWVANIDLIARVVPIPPPTVYLAQVTPGLQQFADEGPSYNRNSVRTFTNGSPLVSWVGQPKPVVYSFNVAAFPTNNGFNLSLCINPGDPTTQTYADPDWSGSNALVLSIAANGDGSQAVTLAYKTNQPSGNGMLFGAGIMTNFTWPVSPVGTWSLTFTSDTDATITSPDGSTHSCSMPASIAPLFADPASYWLFSSPAVDANLGQFATLTSLSLAGVGTPITQDFTTGSLNPLLVLQSQQYAYPAAPNQFLLTTSNGAYWHHWTLPDSGFSPIVTTDLASGAWQGEAYSSIFANGKQRWALVPPASLPGASLGFFALVQYQFSQLQVLLAGETNAPGTLTGKTGTPTPEAGATTGGALVTVTINAVDATWHIVSGVTDVVSLTTSADPNSTLPLNAALVNGTLTEQVLITTSSTPPGFTVTAMDVTDPTKSSNTSSPVEIDP